ncbi:MAG TPA: hypothetical protein VMU51_22660 [Mycobacteriales bacterium]|nr:hypothetical protein [Mycobacteriales bacterium]
MTTPQWATNLVVKVNSITVTPILSFNPTFTVPVVPLHSLEGDNVAHVAQPATFTFTMAVQAIGPVVAMLTDLALKRTSFTVEASEASGDDWSFTSLTFTDCFITSIATTAIIGGVPTATFNCICLQVTPVANG